MPFGLFRRRAPAPPEQPPVAEAAALAAPLFPVRPPAAAIAEPHPPSPPPIQLKPPAPPVPMVAEAAPRHPEPPRPPPQTAIGPRLPHGPALGDIVADGRASAIIELHKQSTLTRPAPFHADPMVDGVSVFAAEFENPARRVSEPGAVQMVFGAQTQVRLMRNARHVIGENSGGLANVMFCRRGARLLELSNPTFPHPAHWALMGLVQGGYGFNVGQHVGDDTPNLNSDYAVPVEDFTRAVEALVAA